MRLSLVFQNDADSALMNLLGRATVVDDRAKMKELYAPPSEDVAPQGRRRSAHDAHPFSTPIAAIFGTAPVGHSRSSRISPERL